MSKSNSTKIKLLRLWDMLTMDSDETHPLSTADILSRLEEQGISCDRRTLYADIKTLNEYGYETTVVLRNHSNHYYVSNRGFNVPELKILMDAVTAVTFISNSKSKELHNKIAGLEGSCKAELLRKSQDADNLVKTENEMLYYSVNELDEAITNGKKVTFQYFDYTISGERRTRKGGEQYIVNPICTVISDDKYYLLAYLCDEERIRHYRIDHMKSVRVLDEPVQNPRWLKKVNIAQHKKATFSMFDGKSVRVVFDVDNSLAGAIFDRFGYKTILKDIGDGRFSFSADIKLSNMFFGWCLSFGDKLKVVSPIEVTIQMADYLKLLTKQYS